MTQFIKIKPVTVKTLSKSSRSWRHPSLPCAFTSTEVSSWQMSVCLLKHSLNSEVGRRGRSQCLQFWLFLMRTNLTGTTLWESNLFMTGPWILYEAFCFPKWVLWEDFNNSDPRGIGYSAINILEHEHLSRTHGYCGLLSLRSASWVTTLRDQKRNTSLFCNTNFWNPPD